ncbi:MAG: tRNA pseudouridine synthase [Gemmatimonadetes bacterium]|nr:tRNA pseudouridine synthase [Gemmatimonadota bacterium]
MEKATADRQADASELGGVLLVDKPAGITSHDAVAIVRRAAHTRRVGHTGTLDPFATGLLVMLIGRGTRLIPYVDGEPKVYEATIRFGAETDTDDGTGTTTRTAELPADGAIEEGIRQLTGPIDQVPPAYSAKQVDGTRAYAAARGGRALELEPCRVNVHEWTILGRDGADLRVRISCGGGTYIRALARDLGRLTTSAAHLSALRRTRTGQFSVDDAATLDAIAAGALPVQSLRAAIPSLPVRRLDASELGRVGHGNPIAARAGDLQAEGARIALVDDEETLIAVAERAGSELRPKLVLRDG